MHDQPKHLEMHPRLRILYVEGNEDGTVGGSHRSLFELVTRLDPVRFEPVILFYEDNIFVERLRERGIEVHLFDAERAREWQARTSGKALNKAFDILVQAVRRRARLIRLQEIDLVHLNNSPLRGFSDWLPASQLCGVPCVASVRGDARGAEKPWHRHFYRYFTKLMPVSAWIGDAMRNAGVPERKIEVVLNGVDVEGYRNRISRTPEEVRSSIGISADELLVVMVGNFQPWKGHQVVLDALTQLRKDSKIFVALVGDVSPGHREHEAHLKEFVSSHDLSDRVSFLGRRSDIPDLFSAADVALHASLEWEPFGLVVVEAMAVGTPVIASDGGGPREILTAETGFTHNPETPHELAGILRTLLNEPESLKSMKSAVLGRAAEFDIADTVRKMEAVYVDICGNRPSRYRQRKDPKEPLRQM